MNGPSPILLAKLARDAGFVVELDETDGWLAPCRTAISSRRCAGMARPMRLI